VSNPDKAPNKFAGKVTPEVAAAVEAKVVDGRITCAVARKLAEDLGVPYAMVGAALDEAGHKVKNCDLNCF
jgi:LAO/AO transport system kinase